MQRLLRFTLDLFDPADLAPARPVAPERPPEAPSGPKGSFFEPNDADALVQRSFDAIKKEVSAPPQPDSSPALGYRHPLANREARLSGTAVGYQLKRARRRTIGFSIRDGGLVVAAPGWVPIGQIESALQEKAAWIVRKLHESRELADRADDQRMRWSDGATLPFLGQPMTLRLESGFGRRGATRLVEDRALAVALPPDAQPEHLRDAVHAFFLAQARQHFSMRLSHFAPQLGVRWQRLRLSNAATRWGSASTSGTIALHWRLIQMAPQLLDYVVVHELAHLKHMNHSPRFWALVQEVLPDHLALRKQLKSVTLPRWA